MRALIYLRVSTDEQEPAAQLPALLKLCEARGWPVGSIAVETMSGAKKRPKLDETCEQLRRGEAGVLVVWALDRLGRDVWEVITRVRALWAAGVRIVSLQDAWLEGADGPVRDLLLMLLAWVAGFERQRLRERTRAGLAAARAKGKTLGRRPENPDKLEGAAQFLERATDESRSIRYTAKLYGLKESTFRAFLKRRARNKG